ncbi:MAG: ABC transporter ATP-binding protein [Thermomicrobiales bacterium]
MTTRTGTHPDSVPVVEAREITKRFGPIVANNRVFLALRAGEIHAVLGENGAGKTTLLNILSGVYQPDAGEILVDGRPATLHSPAGALRQGIGAVHQHFALAPNLSALENVILGAASGFRLDLGQAERRVVELFHQMGLKVSPRTEVHRLALGQRQRVEIVKALFRGSRVLLLDEPTSVLTPGEVDGLFAILRRLRAEGVAIALITHKLDEALAVSDRITVLRQGSVAGTVESLPRSERGGGEAKGRIVELMFGGSPPREALPAPHAIGPPLLTLHEVSAVDDRGAPAVRDCSLDLHAGEILGIAGVDGNGQTELAEVIAGQRRATAGRVDREGLDVTNRGVAATRAAGIGYVTDDRFGEGIVARATVAENAVLKAIARPPFSRRFWLNRHAIADETRRMIAAFDVRAPGPGAPAGALSGGNIQKLLLARELALNPAVLVCNKPTAGLDVRTAQFVLHTLRAHAGDGNGVLLISAEFDELLEVSDRIAVMFRGAIVHITPRDQADVEEIGRLMLTGAAPVPA